jgi:hypothetical protein
VALNGLLPFAPVQYQRPNIELTVRHKALLGGDNEVMEVGFGQWLGFGWLHTCKGAQAISGRAKPQTNSSCSKPGTNDPESGGWAARMLLLGHALKPHQAASLLAKAAPLARPHAHSLHPAALLRTSWLSSPLAPGSAASSTPGSGGEALGRAAGGLMGLRCPDNKKPFQNPRGPSFNLKT